MIQERFVVSAVKDFLVPPPQSIQSAHPVHSAYLLSRPIWTLFIDLSFQETPRFVNYEDTDLEPSCSTDKKASEAMPNRTATSTNPAPAKATRKRHSAGSFALGTPDQNGKPVTGESVQVRAYQKWESAGKPAGDGIRFWLEAERELLQGK